MNFRCKFAKEYVQDTNFNWSRCGHRPFNLLVDDFRTAFLLYPIRLMDAVKFALHHMIHAFEPCVNPNDAWSLGYTNAMDFGK